MGVNKGATDIWKFGRLRPDLTDIATFEAEMPVLTKQQMSDRQDGIDKLIQQHYNNFVDKITHRLSDRKSTL